MAEYKNFIKRFSAILLVGASAFILSFLTRSQTGGGINDEHQTGSTEYILPVARADDAGCQGSVGSSDGAGCDVGCSSAAACGSGCGSGSGGCSGASV